MDADQRAIRKAARLRSSLLPGMGFGLLGHTRLAAIGLVLTALSVPIVAVACFHPEGGLAWLALAFILASILFWIFESIAVGRMTIRPSGGSDFLSRHRMAAYAIAYTCAAAVLICFFLNFGSLRIGGNGMIPTVQPGELILYHKRVEAADLVPGAIIAFRVSPESSWGHPWEHPGSTVMGRILAVPGDTIGIDGTRYRVNGKESVGTGPLGPERVVLDVPEAPARRTVPPDCFFVVQDSPSGAFDSRVLSSARRQDIVATRLWLLSRRGLGQHLR